MSSTAHGRGGFFRLYTEIRGINEETKKSEVKSQKSKSKSQKYEQNGLKPRCVSLEMHFLFIHLSIYPFRLFPLTALQPLFLRLC